MLISVVVPTYNRADLLLRWCLGSLCFQTLDPSQYEIIVVDNNSPDDTGKVVESFRTKLPNLRYLFEKRAGVALARNRGYWEARGDYVGYTDDDAMFPPRWLSLAATIIQDQKPEGFGGPFFPFYLETPPYWYKDSYGGWTHGDVVIDLPPNVHLSGMNMFFKRETLIATKGFPEELGHQGNKLAYGEEPAIQQSIRELFPAARIYYHPDLYVFHHHRHAKMTGYGHVYDSFTRGRYAVKVARHSSQRSPSPGRLLNNLSRNVMGVAIDVMMGFPRRNRERYPYIMNYFYEVILPHLYQFGINYEALCALLGSHDASKIIPACLKKNHGTH